MKKELEEKLLNSVCVGYFIQASGNYDLMLCEYENSYYLGLKNTETTEYLTRDFNILDEAIIIFNKMVEILIKNIGNDTYKKNVFYSSIAL